MTIINILKQLSPENASEVALDIVTLMKDGMPGVMKVFQKLENLLNESGLPRSSATAITLLYLGLDVLKEYGFTKSMLQEMMTELYDIHDQGLKAKLLKAEEAKLDSKVKN